MWSSIRPVEPALHCDHVTRKIRSCKPNNREKEGGRRLVRDKQRFAGHFGCGRAARHALCHTYHMQWVRPGEQLVNQSGALVFFNINHTEHTERGGGTKWETVRSGQEQQQTRNCCHEQPVCRQLSCPVGFGVTTWRWYPYATLAWPAAGARNLSVIDGSRRWPNIIIIHHMWSVAGGGERILHSFVGIFKLQLKQNKTMRNIDIKYQSNLLQKIDYFHFFFYLFSSIRIPNPNPNRNRVNSVIECYCQNKYQLIWMGHTDKVCACVCIYRRR